MTYYFLPPVVHIWTRTDNANPIDESAEKQTMPTDDVNGNSIEFCPSKEWPNQNKADWFLSLLSKCNAWGGQLPTLSDQAMARKDQESICSSLVKIFHICMCPAHPPPGLRFHDLESLMAEVQQYIQRAAHPFVATQALLCPFISQCWDAMQFLYDEDQGPWL